MSYRMPACLPCFDIWDCIFFLNIESIGKPYLFVFVLIARLDDFCELAMAMRQMKADSKSYILALLVYFVFLERSRVKCPFNAPLYCVPSGEKRLLADEPLPSQLPHRGDEPEGGNKKSGKKRRKK